MYVLPDMEFSDLLYFILFQSPHYVVTEINQRCNTTENSKNSTKKCKKAKNLQTQH